MNTCRRERKTRTRLKISSKAPNEQTLKPSSVPKVMAKAGKEYFSSLFLSIPAAVAASGCVAATGCDGSDCSIIGSIEAGSVA